MRPAHRLAALSLASLAACGPAASPPAACASFTYSDYGACQPGGTQTRTVLTSSSSGCTGGAPVTTQACSDLRRRAAARRHGLRS